LLKKWLLAFSYWLLAYIGIVYKAGELKLSGPLNDGFYFAGRKDMPKANGHWLKAFRY